MIERKINSPETSSLGRLFDAVAAVILGRRTVDYEAQAAIELEGIADAEPDRRKWGTTCRSCGKVTRLMQARRCFERT